MCFVGLLSNEQHRQHVIFHLKHVIQDKTMYLASGVWMGSWGGAEVFFHMGDICVFSSFMTVG